MTLARFTRIFGVLLLGVFLLVPVFIVSAETESERKERLEAELAEVESQILKQQVLVEDKQLERQTLERDVAILDAQIEKAKLGIKARTIEIESLGGQIGDKVQVIGELGEKLDRQRESLAQLLRRTHEIDDYTLAEVVLTNTDLSSFFEDLDSFDAIKESLKDSFKDIRETRTDTEEQKTTLEDRQQREVELRKLQELEKAEIEAHEKEKSRILSVTKGEEAAYQALLQQQQKTAAQIRAQLFELRDSTAIPFPEALRLAQMASSKTGVRTALILGILTQETQLGENIGVAGIWTRDMHPTRDQPIFKVIMETLGLDPDSMPVSPRPGYGWGGAMGPSQFIPSTWVHYGGFVQNGSGEWVYDKNADVIRALLGKDSPSNPYDNQDAFMATALLLRDNGAAAGGFAAERLAALRYFAGWGNASNPAYAFYGDGVMQHASRIEEEIKILSGN